MKTNDDSAKVSIPDTTKFSSVALLHLRNYEIPIQEETPEFKSLKAKVLKEFWANDRGSSLYDTNPHKRLESLCKLLARKINSQEITNNDAIQILLSTKNDPHFGQSPELGDPKKFHRTDEIRQTAVIMAIMLTILIAGTVAMFAFGAPVVLAALAAVITVGVAVGTAVAAPSYIKEWRAEKSLSEISKIEHNIDVCKTFYPEVYKVLEASISAQGVKNNSDEFIKQISQPLLDIINTEKKDILSKAIIEGNLAECNKILGPKYAISNEILEPIKKNCDELKKLHKDVIEYEVKTQSAKSKVSEGDKSKDNGTKHAEKVSNSRTSVIGRG